MKTTLKATNYLYQIVGRDNKIVEGVQNVAETREDARFLKRVAEKAVGDKVYILQYAATKVIR
jgi:hypothetical protein